VTVSVNPSSAHIAIAGKEKGTGSVTFRVSKDDPDSRMVHIQATQPDCESRNRDVAVGALRKSRSVTMTLECIPSN